VLALDPERQALDVHQPAELRATGERLAGPQPAELLRDLDAGDRTAKMIVEVDPQRVGGNHFPSSEVLDGYIDKARQLQQTCRSVVISCASAQCLDKANMAGTG
jgi:hypothetical protein